MSSDQSDKFVQSGWNQSCRCNLSSVHVSCLSFRSHVINRDSIPRCFAHRLSFPQQINQVSILLGTQCPKGEIRYNSPKILQHNHPILSSCNESNLGVGGTHKLTLNLQPWLYAMYSRLSLVYGIQFMHHVSVSVMFSYFRSCILLV